jgi:GNAT superfamily N-acetyltransferase
VVEGDGGDDEGGIVGHVALHRTSSAPVMALAEAATGRPAAELAVVARLLVAPAARRRGIGRALLGTAAAGAVDGGRVPMLDVVPQFTSAVALYEACGWRRVGRVVVALPDGTSLDELVYVLP